MATAPQFNRLLEDCREMAISHLRPLGLPLEPGNFPIVTENHLVQLLHLLSYPPGDVGVAMAVNRYIPGGDPVDIGPSPLIVQINPGCPGDPEHFRVRFMLGKGMPDMSLIAFRKAFQDACI